MKNRYLAAALAAAIFAGPVMAAEPLSLARQAPVSASRLNLGTEVGVRALDLRILHAASELCGSPSSVDARGWAKFTQCRDAARASAAEHRRIAIAAAQGRDAPVVASAR